MGIFSYELCKCVEADRVVGVKGEFVGGAVINKKCQLGKISTDSSPQEKVCMDCQLRSQPRSGRSTDPFVQPDVVEVFSSKLFRFIRARVTPAIPRQ